MNEITIQINELENGVWCINLVGAINAFTFEDCDAALHQLFEEDRYRIILDMSGVTHISSAGGGLLLSATEIVHSHQGKLILAGLQPHVREVLQMMGLLHPYGAEKCLFATETREEAQKQMNASSST